MASCGRWRRPWGGDVGRRGAGARTSTMLQRLPFLPKADAYVSEGGGRIWWHDHTLPTAACIAEDYEWRAQHASISTLACPHPAPVPHHK